MSQVDRFSVSMPLELGSAVRQAAARSRVTVSAWMAEAAASCLRNDLLGRALDQWEAEDGPFDDAELDTAAVALGQPSQNDAA